MMLTPSGSAISFEVLVALRAFDVSVEPSDFAVPVNVREVIVELGFVAPGEGAVDAAEGAGAAVGTALDGAAADGN